MPLDEKRRFIPVNIAVMTVSDSRNLADDRSGDMLETLLTACGHHLQARTLVRDEKEEIVRQVCEWVQDTQIDVILTTGGTGFTGRDVTPDALEPLFDKKMEGFSSIFHHISYQKISTSTIQSRATAGLIETTFIFVLPGSPGACRDAWEGILQNQLDSRFRPCNFVEIMPRLTENHPNIAR